MSFTGDIDMISTFRINSQRPIDDRLVVLTEANRLDMAEIRRHNMMRVSVDETMLNYQLIAVDGDLMNNDNWVILDSVVIAHPLVEHSDVAYTPEELTEGKSLVWDSTLKKWVVRHSLAGLNIVYFDYNFDSSLNNAPAAGYISRDAAPLTATLLYVNKVDKSGNEVTLFFTEMKPGDLFRLVADGENYENYIVGGDPVEYTDTWAIPIIYEADSGALANDQLLSVRWKIFAFAEWGNIDGVLANQADIVAEFAKHYEKSEFIMDSAGGPSAGLPVVLNSSGKLSATMVDLNVFYLVGEYTPITGNEYPDSTGETVGAMWVVAGLSAPYTYVAGDLIGRTVNNEAIISLSETGWVLMASGVTPNIYYKIDGTAALTAPFAGGGFEVMHIANAVEQNSAVTLAQLEVHTLDTDNPHEINVDDIGGQEGINYWKKLTGLNLRYVEGNIGIGPGFGAVEPLDLLHIHNNAGDSLIYLENFTDSLAGIEFGTLAEKGKAAMVYNAETGNLTARASETAYMNLTPDGDFELRGATEVYFAIRQSTGDIEYLKDNVVYIRPSEDGRGGAVRFEGLASGSISTVQLGHFDGVSGTPYIPALSIGSDKSTTIFGTIASSIFTGDGITGDGWKIDLEGNMIVESLAVRGELSVHTLEVVETKVSTGSQVFTEGCEILSIGTESFTYESPYPVTPLFSVADVLMCQQWAGETEGDLVVSYKVKVLTDVDAGDPERPNMRLVTYESVTDPVDAVLVPGQSLVRVSGSIIEISSREGGYIQFADGIVNVEDDWTVRMRQGNVDGVGIGPKPAPAAGYGIVSPFLTLDESGAFFSGELVAATGNFSGKITAAEGEIGGYTIIAASLYSGTDARDTDAFSPEPDITLNADGSLIGMNFRIDTNGDAFFRGNISADSGDIGGMTIDAGAIFSGTKVVTGFSALGEITISSDSGIHTPTFYVDADGAAEFSGALKAASGTFAGALEAVTGDFTGTITAEAGLIAGFIINDNDLTSTGVKIENTIITVGTDLVPGTINILGISSRLAFEDDSAVEYASLEYDEGRLAINSGTWLQINADTTKFKKIIIKNTNSNYAVSPSALTVDGSGVDEGVMFTYPEYESGAGIQVCRMFIAQSTEDPSEGDWYINRAGSGDRGIIMAPDGSMLFTAENKSVSINRGSWGTGHIMVSSEATQGAIIEFTDTEPGAEHKPIHSSGTSRARIHSSIKSEKSLKIQMWNDSTNAWDTLETWTPAAVGVLTSAPKSTLDVNGDITFKGAIESFDTELGFNAVWGFASEYGVAGIQGSKQEHDSEGAIVETISFFKHSFTDDVELVLKALHDRIIALELRLTNAGI